jgi:hypothetical protein
VVVQEWDRRRGQLGKREAEDQARTTRAQEQRQGQHLRSGVLELRSSNVTYIWEKGIWSNEDPQSVARVASGPIVARAEFLPSAFGGGISLGPRAVAAAWPVDECRNIDPLLPDNVSPPFMLLSIFVKLSGEGVVRDVEPCRRSALKVAHLIMFLSRPYAIVWNV